MTLEQKETVPMSHKAFSSCQSIAFGNRGHQSPSSWTHDAESTGRFPLLLARHTCDFPGRRRAAKRAENKHPASTQRQEEAADARAMLEGKQEILMWR